MIVDFNSFNKICKNSNQVMVYGWGHCKYLQITEALNERGTQINKTFCCSLGNRDCPLEKKTTLEGQEIEQLLVEPDCDGVKVCSRQCKAAITNLCLENFKRRREGFPIIPVVFITDIDGNPYVSNAETISSKGPLNRLITHSELRRAYKLCKEVDHEEFRIVAQDTFRFVKLKIENEVHSFESIPPPWDSPEWKLKWAERKVLSILVDKLTDWKQQLADSIARFSIRT